jgi:prepilin-type N-terminal cleavage/methylation domain-containing protein
MFIDRQEEVMLSRKGFSLMELLVVITIIGILLMIAVPNWWKIQEDVRKKACIAQMRTIYGAAQLYLMENPGSENATVEKLLETRHLKDRPICPKAKRNEQGEPVDASYKIVDVFGKPLDVVCVNTGSDFNGHGSLRKLLGLTPGEQPTPQPTPTP